MIDLNILKTALAGPLAPLTQWRQFVLWRLEPDPKGGKPRKMPYRIDGRQASSTDPTGWVDAATALEAAARSGMYVGFVLTNDDPIVFIDVDGCVVDGKWDEDALDVFARFPDAMFEVSQSGKGMHLFVTGDVPEGFTGKKRGKFECYKTARFVALTGISAQGALYNYGQTLSTFINDKFPSSISDSHVGPLKWTTFPIQEWNGPTDDEELLRQFLSAPPPRSANEAFSHLSDAAPAVTTGVQASNADLFNANPTALGGAYPSDKGDAFDKSAAAFALACRLAYWTGKDCARVERLMNRASFRRSRADQYHDSSVTYMQWDVMRACSMTTRVMFQRPSAINAEVVADAAQAYDSYFDRISAAGDVHAIRAVASEVSVDLRIDPTLRELLAGHLQTTLARIGSKLKIDDCRKLVAQRSARPATDLRELTRQTNIALSLPQETVLLAPVMSIADMIDQFVFISDGSQVGSIYERYMNFALADFHNTLGASVSISADGKTIEHTKEWIRHSARKMVQTRTFHAGAPIVTHDPSGRTALNMWRPTTRGAATADIAPFVDQVQYLFGADTDAFLNWLAHIEQCPGKLPHFGWLHIADKFGTGRNWLASVLNRLWLGYVAPSVNMDSLINGGFNGVIAGRVLAVVDEIRAGAAEDAYMMEGKIRNMLTEESRYIKPKYGREYIEHNACRWLLFSNHKNAIPMSDSDRRWHVVHLTADWRPDHVYAHLYSLLDSQSFIDSIGVWLRQRDISGFNPGARPPVTSAKSKAIEASKSEYQKLAAQLLRAWPCDFISVADLINVMHEGDMTAKRLTGPMRHALEDLGMYCVGFGIWDENGNRQRCWIVRNVEAWLAPNVLRKETTATAFAAYRPFARLGGFSTLQDRL